MGRKLKSMAIALIAAAPLCAMDWPSPDAVMVRNFGFNDQGRPVLGTVFEGEGAVLAAENGELIFAYSGKGTASRLPSPLGTWMAVDHGDGLVSIYSRMDSAAFAAADAADETAAAVRQQPRIERGSPLAPAGISGWSQRSGFYFILYDRRERRWINPSMIITPVPDTRPPQIVSVRLKDAQGLPAGSGQSRLKQGPYTVSVHAVDSRISPEESQLAPYRIICSVNGAEAGMLNFETIPARDGVLMVYRNGLVPARQVYASFPAFEAGEIFLTRGQANLEIIVQDIAGNSRSAVSRLIVE